MVPAKITAHLRTARIAVYVAIYDLKHKPPNDRMTHDCTGDRTMADEKTDRRWFLGYFTSLLMTVIGLLVAIPA